MTTAPAEAAPPPVRVGTPTIVQGSRIPEETQRALYDLAAQVAGYNLRRRQLEKDVADVRTQLLARRAQLLFDVHGELNEGGKPRFPNSEQREAAIVQRATADDDFRALEARRRELQDEYDRVAVEYSVLKDNLNILMAAAGVEQPVIESNYKTLFDQMN